MQIYRKEGVAGHKVEKKTRSEAPLHKDARIDKAEKKYSTTHSTIQLFIHISKGDDISCVHLYTIQMSIVYVHGTFIFTTFPDHGNIIIHSIYQRLIFIQIFNTANGG